MTDPAHRSQTPDAKLPPAYPYAQRPALPPPAKPPLPDDWPVQVVMRLPVALSLLYLGCLAFNGLAAVAIAQLRPEPIALVAMVFGVFWGQLAGLCGVIVFGEFRFWLRLLVVWALGCSLGLSFMTGFILIEGWPGDLGKVLRVILCGLPMVALATQLPLWAARFYLGWRIVRPTDNFQSPQPLSIGDIFNGTAVAALTVGAARFVPHDGFSDVAFWTGWAIAVPSIAGISLISVLPALYLVLRLQQIAIGCIALPVYALVAAVVTLIVIGVVSQRAPDDEAIVVFPVMLLTYAAMLLGLLGLMRWRGYRLVFPSDRWMSEPDLS